MVGRGRRGRTGAVVPVVLLALLLLAVPAAGPPGGSAAGSGPIRASTAASLGASVPAAGAPYPGQVLATDLPNYNASLPGNFPSTVANLEVGTPAYVPSTGSVWWPELPTAGNGTPAPPTGPALQFNATTYAFTGVVPAVSNVSAFLLDAPDARLYAAEPRTNSVAVLSPTTGASAAASIPVGFDPVALGLDTALHLLFVVNRNSSNVTVVSTVSDRVVVAGVPVGSLPSTVAVDAADGWVFVGNSNASVLSVLNASAPTFSVPPIPLPDGPASSLAFSTASGRLAVASSASRDLTIVVGANRTVVTSSVPAGANTSAVIAFAAGASFAVANASAGTLRTVLASPPYTVGATPLAVAPDPRVLVEDPATGDILVWSAAARTVTAVDLFRSAVDAVTPALRTAPLAAAFDPTSGSAFVADTWAPALDRIDPFSGANDAPPIPLAGVPSGVAVDPTRGLVYVAEPNRVVALNASTGAVVASASLTGPNGPILVDPVSGTLWVGRSADNDVVGLSLGALAPRATTGAIGTSAAWPGSIAFAAGSDTVWVVDTSDQNSVRGFSGASGAFVSPDVYCGPNVTSVAFDAADGLLYALGDTLAAFDPSSLAQPLYNVSIGAHAFAGGLAYDPTDGVLWAHVNDESQAGSLVAIDGRTAAASMGTFAVLRAGYGGGVPLVLAPAPGPLAGAPVIVLPNELSGTLTVVGQPLNVSGVFATPSIVDVNATAGLDAQVTGGAGALAVSWSGLPTGCASNDSLSLGCSPTAPGPTTVSVSVSDRLGERADGSTSLSVLEPLRVNVTILGSGTEVDADVVGFYGAGVAGGSYPVTFAWTFSDGGNASGQVVGHAFPSPGSAWATVVARDPAGGVAVATAPIDVLARPSIAIATVDGARTDVGVPLALAANVSGGVGPFNYSWSFADGSASAHGPLASHTWGTAGLFNISVTTRDADGVLAGTDALVTVAPALAADPLVAAGPGGPGVGVPFAFAASPSEGTPAYAAVWSFGDGSSAAGLNVSHAYAANGTYTVVLTLTDAVGGTVERTLSVSVGPASAASGPVAPNAVGPSLVLGLVLGGAAASVALFLAERAKHRRPTRPPTPYEPPTAPPGSG